jgi:putative transposase
MLEAVKLRFGTVQAPHAVEWLSDNGSPFTARETLDFAAALGLVPCFTPVQSPESNGIAEAFGKTFKRDYARVHPLLDAATVLRQIARWFDDYNESHPRSGLGMISPSSGLQTWTTLYAPAINSLVSASPNLLIAGSVCAALSFLQPQLH